MAVLVDAFGAATEYVQCSPGTTGAASTSDYTIVAMYLPLAISGATMGLFHTGTAQRVISHDSLTWFGTNDFSSGFGAAVVGDWFMIGQSKPAGSHHYRWHQYDYSTEGTITHGESTGSANQGDGLATDAIRIGAADGAHTWGSFAWVAIWKRVLSDVEFESLCTAALADVMALSPDALIPCNVAALADIVDVTGNGADYASQSGANITVGDDPAGYDFTLGGGGTDHAGAIASSVTATLAPAATHIRFGAIAASSAPSLTPTPHQTHGAAISSAVTANLAPAPTHIRPAAIAASTTPALTPAATRTHPAAIAADVAPTLLPSTAGQQQAAIAASATATLTSTAQHTRAAAITAAVAAALATAFTAARTAAVTLLVHARLIPTPAGTVTPPAFEFTTGTPQLGWRVDEPTPGWDTDQPQTGWRTGPPRIS